MIGVGNPWRRDDGAGWATVDAAAPRLAGTVELVRTDGEPAGLIEAWTGSDLAVLVDAVRTGSPAGTIHPIDLGGCAEGETGATSSHGLGVVEAVHLGRALGRMPRRLHLFGIEGEDFRYGPQPGRSVTDAVSRVVEGIVDLVCVQDSRIPLTSGRDGGMLVLPRKTGQDLGGQRDAPLAGM